LFALCRFLNEIHVDDKWFSLKPLKRRVLRRSTDTVFSDSTQTKSKIPKLMFLCAVGVPQYRSDGSFFDGKIGVFPFVYWAPAKKNSKNRPAGTMELKTHNVDAAAYLHVMTMNNGVFDNVRLKMAWLQNTQIVIQQDNAKPHIGKGNMNLLNLRGKDHGFNICVQNQPAQSPDLNKLDLAFFHGLNREVMKYKFHNSNVQQLMNNVVNAFEQYPVDKLITTNALLYVIYRKVLESLGSIQYNTPHTHIRHRLRHDLTNVVDYSVDVNIVQNAFNFLNVT
jgi:hypothetical protein